MWFDQIQERSLERQTVTIEEALISRCVLNLPPRARQAPSITQNCLANHCKYWQESTEEQEIPWQGDPVVLPLPPESDDPAAVAQFSRAMDDFLAGWHPTHPEGSAWRLVRKSWYCEQACLGCWVPQPGRNCHLQGRYLRSYWVRADAVAAQGRCGVGCMIEAPAEAASRTK